MATTSIGLQESILAQRKMLTQLLGNVMHEMSNQCAKIITQPEKMEKLIHDSCPRFSYCKHIYILDSKGVQITRNITQTGFDPVHQGRDRTGRPYMQEIMENSDTLDFSLSEAYISCNKKRPSLTAVQTILDTDGKLLGFLGADFDLRELPRSEEGYKEPDNWRQIKGDPAIRSGLFTQSRAESPMDARMDEVLAIMEELITQQGVFHGKFHFSSSRCTIWQIDDPFIYRILTIDELTDPDTCLALPHRDYPERAIVPKEKIKPVFEMLRSLRFADENVYLRAGSLNIINGMVGLNFSCDGSHYMMFDEFLEKNTEFWFGQFS